MSELDKEAVLDEFTAAYKKAHGKQPKVEDSNGWYSVDGSKNMRLAQLDEWTQELKSGKADAVKKDTGKASTTKTAKKTTKASGSKSKGSKKAPQKKAKKTTAKNKSSGHTPAQAWQAHLDQQAGDSRLPRGLKTE